MAQYLRKGTCDLNIDLQRARSRVTRESRNRSARLRFWVAVGVVVTVCAAILSGSTVPVARARRNGGTKCNGECVCSAYFVAIKLGRTRPPYRLRRTFAGVLVEPSCRWLGPQSFHHRKLPEGRDT